MIPAIAIGVAACFGIMWWLFLSASQDIADCVNLDMQEPWGDL